MAEGFSYLEREPSRHQPLELVEVEGSPLVAVVLVEYGSHLFLSRMLAQRPQGLFQLDLQHQAVSIAVEKLLPGGRMSEASVRCREGRAINSSVKEPALQLINVVRLLSYTRYTSTLKSLTVTNKLNFCLVPT